ncbi:mechanosensitive ion channel family protein [Aurantiacibacter xanthus]|uniref:Small-conductance mechanosensitive channel n=1 Tax=Aurantiacibacter xanthus TaxID=1784712 RepID=A0A3A1PEL2_9SPHN|nr:mechanosensitive ion channel [Aurantiacibacter xanthus]RIV91471.1 mechanosensitive ion channel family protein [Aurantiacibacter xanthus]
MNYVKTITDQVEAMWMGFIAILPNLVLSIIVLMATWVVARFAVRIADRIVGHTNVRTDLKNLTATAVRLLIWIVGILIAAAVAIPGFTPAGMIAGLGVGALAIGFAFQDIFENFLAGVLIMLRDKMNIGDWVDADGVSGTVEKITLRETHIRQFSGELTILPNSMIFKNAVKIHTDQPVRRYDLMVGVSYDCSLPEAEAAILRALESVEGIYKDKPVDAYAREFGGSSIDFLVRWWVDTDKESHFIVHRDVVYAIKRELDEAEIDIPFPIVTNMFPEVLPLERARKDEESGKLAAAN